jgi:hypothetical protein
MSANTATPGYLNPPLPITSTRRSKAVTLARVPVPKDRLTGEPPGASTPIRRLDVVSLASTRRPLPWDATPVGVEPSVFASSASPPAQTRRPLPMAPCPTRRPRSRGPCAAPPAPTRRSLPKVHCPNLDPEVVPLTSRRGRRPEGRRLRRFASGCGPKAAAPGRSIAGAGPKAVAVDGARSDRTRRSDFPCRTDGSDPKAAAADVATLVAARKLPPRAVRCRSTPESAVRQRSSPPATAPKGVVISRREREACWPEGRVAAQPAPAQARSRRTATVAMPTAPKPIRRSAPWCRSDYRCRGADPRVDSAMPARRPTPWSWPESHRLDASPLTDALVLTRRSSPGSRPGNRRPFADPKAGAREAVRRPTP